MRIIELIQAFQQLVQGVPVNQTVFAQINRVDTFDEIGEDTADDGVVLTMTDGSVFALPIRQERTAKGDFSEEGEYEDG